MKFLFRLSVILSLTLFLVSCDISSDVVSIEVLHNEAQVIVIDDFDLSDLTLRITYDDGKFMEVSLNDSMLSSEDLAKLSTIGIHIITVKYESFQTIFTIKLDYDGLTKKLRSFYTLSQTSNAFEGTYEEWLASIQGPAGTDGREVSLKVADGYIQWQYQGDTSWSNLIELTTLVGPKGEDGLHGENGLNGIDGREVLFQITSGYIQWKYTGDTSWSNLIELTTLVGPKGEDGLHGENGLNGIDGREVVFQVSQGFIQWQYQGDTSWSNLIELTSLVGPKSNDGLDGLSAYEIYKKYYPGYPGTEQNWINDFVTNQLVKTVTLNFDGGTTSSYKTTYFKGEQLDVLPTTTKQYYTFNSWQVNNQSISNPFYVVDNINITAKWNVIEGAILITNASELNNIRNVLNGTFVLANDIDLGSQEWTPIGKDTAPFTGFLDGQGYTISNLKITESQVYVGLFGYNEGTIKNLKLENVQINVEGSISSFIYAGALVANNTGIIENIETVSGSLFARARGGNIGYVGGIIGFNNRNYTLSNLTNNINLTGETITSIGGIIGLNNSNLTIENAINNGRVGGTSKVGGLIGATFTGITYITNSINNGSLSGTSRVGGLIGESFITNITNSMNLANVNGSSEGIGGLIGYVNTSQPLTITNSLNSGNVTGTSRVGGLIGYADSTNLTMSTNIGNVTGTSLNIGGLIGYGYSTTTITKSLNSGTVSGSQRVGGLIGGRFLFGKTNITNSINNGIVIGNNSNVGGLIGLAENPTLIINTLNTGRVSGTTYIGGLIGGSVGHTTITNSMNMGSVNGTTNVGGLHGAGQAIYVYYSVNFGIVVATQNSTLIGGISGNIPKLNDFEHAYHYGSITSNGVEVAGTNFGTNVTDSSIFNLDFFSTTLNWDTEIWDFTGLDIANGVYPTLENMPVVED